MRITALLENTTGRPDMKTEHGLSLYVETEGKRILFDMGQTELFYENAKALGIDLTAVDLAVLSHGHYDHGGGLSKFLSINDRAPVYVSKDAFLPHYNGREKYIGLDASLADSKRLIFCDGDLELDCKLKLFSALSVKSRYPTPKSGLTEKKGDDFIPDDFRHEQYLLIKEKEKSILISGCSHQGILNITDSFRPDALVGGFHFSKLSLDAALADYARLLASFDTEFFTCHCTGTEQYSFMKQYVKKLSYLSCGKTLYL